MEDSELSCLSIPVQDEYAGYCLSDRIHWRLRRLEGLCINENAGNNEAPIQRVPFRICSSKAYEKHFTPGLVEIGPCGWSGLAEEAKRILAASFIREHVVEDMETLYLKIRMEIVDLRKCYNPGDVRGVDDDLAWIFLVDGCAVLHHIYYTAYQMDDEKTDAYQHMINKDFTARDLLLLQNQLPYPLLRLLISLCREREKITKSVQLFIYNTTHMVVREENEQLLPLDDNAFHLLDLVRSSFIQSIKSPKKSTVTGQVSQKSGMLLDILQRFAGMVLHILPRLVHDILLSKKNDKLSFHPSYYSVGKLKAAGIKFMSISTRSLTDISFSSGTLKLPPILLNDLTATVLMNIAAYEMSTPNRYEVCFYAFFISSLLGQPQDVKELRDNGIIYHNFESDEEVVKLFKDMGMVQKLPREYSEILTQIQKHCEKRYNVWIAQLKYRYFESPWTVFALLGAVIVLCLTFLQTVYTILGYFKQ